MTINYPTSLDTFSDPSATDRLDNPPHDVLHTDINSAVEALQTKVGADSSAVTTSHDYKIAQLEGKSPTITLAGDASGSVTLTNLGSGTLTVTVSDDSHNHTIANVDNLQTTLDGKAASSHTHSYASTSHTHSYAATNHTHSYAASSHTHSYASTSHSHSYHVAGGNYSTDFYANQSFADNWFRSIGGTGWYAQSYGGGIYMIDTTWVRTYNNKAFYSGGGVIRSDGGNAFAMPNSTGTWSFNTVRYDTNGGILRQYLSTAATKANITEMKGVLEYLNERNLIYSLRPVIFTEAEDRTDFEGNPVRTTRGEYGHGLIAEEVLEVAPELAYFGKDGELVSYGNDHLIPDIIAELQRLMPMVEELYSTANPDWVAPVPRSADSIATERAKYDEAAAAQALIGHNDISDPLNGQRHLANEE